MKRLIIAAVIVVLSGFSSASALAVGINERCPVMTDEQADPEITTIYKGKTVAFCCSHCVSKFKLDPERYLANLPQFADADMPPASIGETDHPEGHDHDRGHGHEAEEAEESEEGEEQEIPFLGRLHPVIVHFPVAAIPLALLGFLAWGCTRREMFSKADVPPLLIAMLASVAAVVTGNIRHDAMRFSKSLHEIVEQHQTVGTVVMILCLILVAFRIWRWNGLVGAWRWAYGAGLLVGTVLVGYTGFLGGSLVYGVDHFKFW